MKAVLVLALLLGQHVIIHFGGTEMQDFVRCIRGPHRRPDIEFTVKVDGDSGESTIRFLNCMRFDRDLDLDVDLKDYAAFQNAFAKGRR